MTSNKIVLICCCLILRTGNVNTASLYGEGVPVQKPYIPLTQGEFTQNYQNFATNLIKNRNFANEIDGVIFGPFSVGHGLAVLHEQVILNVSTNGFSSVLETPDLQISNSYRDLLQILTHDPKISITSTIYTQHDHVLLTVGIGKLKTKVNLVDPKKLPEEYIEFINNDVQNKSQFDIPVPSFPNRPGIPDGDYYATTFNYKNSWNSQWITTVKNQSFNSFFSIETLQFIETAGSFDYFANDAFEAVKIPLQGGEKQMVFAKSKKSVNFWFENGKTEWESFVSTIFQLKSDQWAPKNIKLQVPPLSYISGTSYYSQLQQLGITDSMCLSFTKPGNYLDQIAQLSKFSMTSEELSLTIITETKDNISDKNNKLKSRKVREVEDPDSENYSLGEFGQSTRNTRTADADGETETIVLDQPYFWSLEDEKIGPIALGAVLLPIERSPKISANYMEQFLTCGKD